VRAVPVEITHNLKEYGHVPANVPQDYAFENTKTYSLEDELLSQTFSLVV
jgi:hypothetical protein